MVRRSKVVAEARKLADTGVEREVEDAILPALGDELRKLGEARKSRRSSALPALPARRAAGDGRASLVEGV